MSNIDLARRVDKEILFDGVDITDDIRPYFLSLTYTDCEEDETDDLQIQLQDRSGIWLGHWLDSMINAEIASSDSQRGFKIKAKIITQNWHSDGKDMALDCGEFELDSVQVAGPPEVVTIKATSLPYSAQIRQVKKSKAWEAYTLSGIAKELAGTNGMKFMYLSDTDPEIKRAEQHKESGIAFLSRLCHRYGISLKTTNNTIVLFDQAKYESKDVIYTIDFHKSDYIKYSLTTGQSETLYTSCRVSYTKPGSSKCIRGIATIEDYDPKSKNNHQLEITAKANSIAEAKQLAAKLLRYYNKFAKTVSVTIPGNPALVAGQTVKLAGWGAWNGDGKYIIKEAKHTIGSSGYTTQLTLRKCLEGY